MEKLEKRNMQVRSVIDEIDLVSDSIKALRVEHGEKIRLKFGTVLSKNTGYIFCKKSMNLVYFIYLQCFNIILGVGCNQP